MGKTMKAEEILDDEFLTIRAKLLDVAAALDRIERGEGEVVDASRMQLISEAIEIVGSATPHRAERIQLLFSREYDQAWKANFNLASRPL